MKNIIFLSLVIFVFFFLYRSCTKGYDNYGYFVHAKDEIIFNKILSGSDSKIIEHGRTLLEKIILLDQKLDNSNGPDKGLVRWYVCMGIDCDEGWQKSFLTNKREKTMTMDEFEKTKIQEYSQYDPKQVDKDVQKDIKHKAIKLFYLDIYEVPEMMVIDENQSNLPQHRKIYIGTGCTDPYHSEDCPETYRKAMQKAVLYGNHYNKAIASHLDLKIKEDIDYNPTQKFIGTKESGMDRLKIELNDIQPLFGGRQIWIDGSGHVFVQSVRPQPGGLEQKNYAFQLEKNEMEKIVETFIDYDFCSLKDTEKQGLPDHATPKIILENAMGQTFSVWNWDPLIQGGNEENDKRFHTLYRAILRLETKALETMEPVNISPYKS